jgi:3-deoxy-manno-octulosonate cytidylyltransferase (CMP-KDO synthetase)
MSAVGLIPARFAATRFPGKPLARIAGKPMIQRVWEGAREAKGLRDVLVVTEDERIVRACSEFGARAVLTSPHHATGTDRLAEAAAALPDEIVVNVQGDEPLVRGFVIDAVVDALAAAPDAPMSTAVHEADPEGLDDPNRVKAVLDRHGRALWFSRATIPYLRNAEARPVYWQHVGLYGYRRSFLLDFVRLPQTPAERAEGLEQLRALEHGHAIVAAVVAGFRGIPVDVPEDVAKVEAALREAGRS